MAEYPEFRESNRDPSFIRSDSVARDVMRRSITRNSHASVSASTRSWVYSNQQNPPPPPEEVTPTPSPVRTPRPLPDPQLQPQNRTSMLRATNGVDPNDDEEYMNIEANGPGMEFGYQTEGMGRGRGPRVLAGSPTSARGDGPSPSGRSFVGGFVNGLRRLPRVVLKYGTIGDKRKFVRRGTFGTEGTTTSATGMTTGNTLPRYVSNPSTPVAGPSNVQYVQATEMPVPTPALPSANLGPSLSQRRHPGFRITPPSEVIEQDETVQPHDFPPDPPQFTDTVIESSRNNNTVTIYHLPQQEDFTGDEPPAQVPPAPIPTPNRRPDSQHRQSAPEAMQATSSPQSPVLAHPLPAADYRKMTLSSSVTSPETMTTSLTSDPSFSSELNPVKRFFRGLYHLPWIAPERVTVDYRPGGSGRGRGRGTTKKPMASWYRGTPGVVLSSKTASGELDLLSGGSGSKRTSTNTASTPIASPTARVRSSSYDRNRHHHREHRRHRHDQDAHHSNERHSHRRRNTTSTATAEEMQHLRNTSPIIPAAYPYAYPYPYPYPAFQPPPSPKRTHSSSMPRGPRSHRTSNRTPTYPHGYAPYQPPPPAPPMYVIHSPAQTDGSGGAAPLQGQGQVLSPVYMQMQLVPGTFNQDVAIGTSSPPPPASPPSNPVSA